MRNQNTPAEIIIKMMTSSLSIFTFEIPAASRQLTIASYQSPTASRQPTSRHSYNLQKSTFRH